MAESASSMSSNPAPNPQDAAKPDAPVGQPEKQQPEETPPWEKEGGEFDPAKAWALIQNLRKEKAELPDLKAKLSEFEQAKLTAQEKLEQERNEALQERDATSLELARLRAGFKYGLEEDDLDLLGSGTPEEIDARAKRLADRLGNTGKAPPSSKPRERLRGGGDPTAEPEETDLAAISKRMFKR